LRDKKVKNKNIVWYDHQLNKIERSEMKGQKPCILWFTGLSGSGKSTIANAIEVKLSRLKKHTYLLDGNNVHYGLNKDLDFSDSDRVEDIRHIGEVRNLFADTGIIVLSAFLSHFRKDRETGGGLLQEGEFIEDFNDTPFEVCEKREPEGLYRKARKGEIHDFIGMKSSYEAPVKPEIHIKGGLSIYESSGFILNYLQDKNYI